MAWNACSVFGFFGVIWLTLLLFCLAAGCPITLTLHADLLGNILNESVTGTGSADVLLLATFLLTPLVLMALNLLQMTFTMFVKPIAGFCITAALLILSAYQISPLLIGNYAMPMRSTAFLSTGVDLQTGILYALVLAGIAVTVGAVRLRHYDILGWDRPVTVVTACNGLLDSNPVGTVRKGKSLYQKRFPETFDESKDAIRRR